MWKVKVVYFSVFILSIFVDLYNGYVQLIRHDSTAIGAVFKLCVLAFCLYYSLSKLRILKFFLLFTFLYFLSASYWMFNGYVSNYTDFLSTLTRTLYPYAILGFFLANRKKVSANTLSNWILLYSVICSVSMHICNYLGYYKMRDYGYGAHGLFIAGNDLSVSLIIGVCLASYLFTLKSTWKNFLIILIISSALMTIGTSAGIIAVVLNFIFIMVQPMFVKQKVNRFYRRFRIIILVSCLPMCYFSVDRIMNYDDYARNKYQISRLASGGARDVLENAFDKVSKDFKYTDYVFGIGTEELYNRIGKSMSLYEERGVELDQYDILGAFGLLLGSLLMAVPLIYLKRFVFYFKNKRTSFGFWGSIATGMFVIHGFVAGHAFTSIQALTIMLLLFYIYKFKEDLNSISNS